MVEGILEPYISVVALGTFSRKTGGNMVWDGSTDKIVFMAGNTIGLSTGKIPSNMARRAFLRSVCTRKIESGIKGMVKISVTPAVSLMAGVAGLGQVYGLVIRRFC